MNDHHWSGWPGAWCLDCGAECLLAAQIDCIECFIVCCPQDEGKEEKVCTKHVQKPCLHPGENLFNPYVEENENE